MPSQVSSSERAIVTSATNDLPGVRKKSSTAAASSNQVLDANEHPLVRDISARPAWSVPTRWAGPVIEQPNQWYDLAFIYKTFTGTHDPNGSASMFNRTDGRTWLEFYQQKVVPYFPKGKSKIVFFKEFADGFKGTKLPYYIPGHQYTDNDVFETILVMGQAHLKDKAEVDFPVRDRRSSDEALFNQRFVKVAEKLYTLMSIFENYKVGMDDPQKWLFDEIKAMGGSFVDGSYEGPSIVAKKAREYYQAAPRYSQPVQTDSEGINPVKDISLSETEMAATTVVVAAIVAGTVSREDKKSTMESVEKQMAAWERLQIKAFGLGYDLDMDFPDPLFEGQQVSIPNAILGGKFNLFGVYNALLRHLKGDITLNKLQLKFCLHEYLLVPRPTKLEDKLADKSNEDAVAIYQAFADSVNRGGKAASPRVIFKRQGETIQHPSVNQINQLLEDLNVIIDGMRQNDPRYGVDLSLAPPSGLNVPKVRKGKGKNAVRLDMVEMLTIYRDGLIAQENGGSPGEFQGPQEMGFYKKVFEDINPLVNAKALVFGKARNSEEKVAIVEGLRTDVEALIGRVDYDPKVTLSQLDVGLSEIAAIIEFAEAKWGEKLAINIEDTDILVEFTKWTKEQKGSLGERPKKVLEKILYRIKRVFKDRAITDYKTFLNSEKNFNALHNELDRLDGYNTGLPEIQIDWIEVDEDDDDYIDFERVVRILDKSQKPNGGGVVFKIKGSTLYEIAVKAQRREQLTATEQSAVRAIGEVTKPMPEEARTSWEWWQKSTYAATFEKNMEAELKAAGLNDFSIERP